MKHEHVSELLGAWLDGELPADQVAAVEAELAECAACQEDMEGLIAMREAFREPVFAAAQAVSFDGVWERIEASIGPSLAPDPVPEVLPDTVRRAVVAEEQSGLWERFVAAWNNVFGAQPLLPAVFAAALVVAVAVALLLPDGAQDKGVPVLGAPEISAMDPGKGAPPPTPISADGEENNRAWISSVQYTQGTVIIDQVPDDPSEPTIVWHYEDEPVNEETQGG